MIRIRKILTDQRGTTGIVMGVSLFTLVGIAAITLDIGRAFVARSELQNIADSAALAAGNELGKIYVQNGSAQAIISGSEKTTMFAQANGLAQQHQAGGTLNITLASGDMTVGLWDVATEQTNATVVNPDAVTISAKRVSGQNGPLAMIFAPIFGVQNMGLSASATAALGPATYVPPGTINAPFGISEQWFVNGGQCNDQIKFSPSHDPLACAGWHAFDEVQQGSNPNSPTHCSSSSGPGGGKPYGVPGEDSANGRLMKKVMECMGDGNYTSPEVEIGKTEFDFNQGEVTNIFDTLNDLYLKEAAKSDPKNEWEVMIPVYESTDCLGPTGPRKIVGFAKATIYGINAAPDERTIDARVECNMIVAGGQSGPPGSGNGGLSVMGSIPGLVK